MGGEWVTNYTPSHAWVVTNYTQSHAWVMIFFKQRAMFFLSYNNDG